ncbi:MAG: phytanoyl-CoA dioxygenase family protein [Myxococcales bacterium]|nr:phytanoyl-CoA dioxygenase family protein [Myxococcales bacterium]
MRTQFERDGFLVLPDFVGPGACAALREAADALAAETDLDEVRTIFDVREQRHGEDRWFLDSGGEVRAFLEPERDGDAVRINKIGHALHDRLPSFDRFSRTPELAALVRELGVARPLLLQSMLIFKEPRVGGEVTAHQDATYLVTEPPSVLGLWFALDDATRENGCLELLPGGHREGLRRRYRRDGDRTWTEELDARPWPEAGWRAAEVRAGALVVFHGLTPHRSGPHRSTRTRRAYTLHVIDGAARYADDNWLRRPPELPLRGFS